MDIWLIYLIKTIILPMCSLLLLSFFGCFYVIKNKGKGRWFLISPLSCLLVLSLPVVAVMLAESQERFSPLDYSVVDKTKPQVIVVIGGGVDTYSPELGLDISVNSRTLVRLRYVAYLAKKTKLPVLVSGGSVFGDIDESEASLMAATLTNEFNIPVKWLESQSRNTAENAIYSQQLLAKEQVDRIILVTHAMHMNRAVEQFERVGLTVIPAPTSLTKSTPTLLSFLPSARALETSSMAIHECLGRLWYSLRY